ncbi:DUF1631 family protein [Formivibrio citricus]|uniref:DUF1631 family protein n=1 Tax=Formivibrio citricus TaxID=83765 RepID=UPI0015A6B38C|nr:DUF1631 family protein [Formivibrio citricus]
MLLNACKVDFLRGYASALEAVLSGEQVRILLQSIQMQSPAWQEGVARDAGKVLAQEALASIEKLLSRSLQTAYDSFRPSFSMPSTLDSLSLVEHSSVEENLRIDEITARLTNAAEDEIRDLNARIAKLFEQEEIRPRENPFRPYLISRSLVTATGALGVEEDRTQVLAARIVDALTEVVWTIYRPVNSLLESSGIDANIELRIKHLHSPGLERKADGAASPLTGAAAPAASERLLEMMLRMGGRLPVAGQTSSLALAPAEPGHALFGWLPKGLQAEETLRQFFASPPASGRWGIGMPPAQLGAGMQGGALIDAVRAQIQGKTQELAVDADGVIPNRILEQRDSLVAQAGNVAEQMVLDIIGMLFEYILCDKMLPLEVRVQLGRLQFVLLKAALADPSLFSRADHAACLLFNRVSSLGCGLSQDDPWSEKFLTEIRRVVGELLRDESDGEPAFAFHLHALEAFVVKELPLVDENAERAVSAVESAERRSACFLRITRKMTSILLHMEIDSYLQGFLTGPWTRVIAHAARDNQKKAEGLCNLVPKLVWSTYPKMTRESRQQLLGMIPALVTDLRAGLSEAGLGEDVQEEVLNWMMGAHRQALRPNMQQPQHEPELAQVSGEFSVLLLAIAPSPDNTALKLDLQYLNEALQEFKVGLLDLDPVLEPGTLHFPSRHIAQGGQAISLRLQTGVNLELEIEGQPWPVRIMWQSAGGERLILKVDGKPLPALISRGVLCNQFSVGRCRFVENQPLCERAIQSLMETVEKVEQSRT